MRPQRDSPKLGERGWFPDPHGGTPSEFARTTPGERVAKAIALSRTATRIAAAAHRGQARAPSRRGTRAAGLD
jgi:hypothetical protein